MATLGPVSASSSDSVGFGLSWQSLASIQGANGSFAFIERNNVFKDTLISLRYAGTLIGDNKAQNLDIDPPDPAEYRSYGGSADGWGASLTRPIIVSETFGVLIEWTDQSEQEVTEGAFVGFDLSSLPSGVTVDGVLVEVLVGPNSDGDFYPGIDNVRITITYTPVASGSGMTIGNGSAFGGLIFGGRVIR